MKKEIVSVILLFGSTLELNRLRVPNFRLAQDGEAMLHARLQPKFHSRTKTGIENRKKVPVFRFPVNEEESAAWLRVIPFKNIQPSKEAVLCEDHWPSSYPTVSKKGRLSSRDPPSIWPASVPPSCIPNPPPCAALRPTKR